LGDNPPIPLQLPIESARQKHMMKKLIKKLDLTVPEKLNKGTEGRRGSDDLSIPHGILPFRLKFLRIVNRTSCFPPGGLK